MKLKACWITFSIFQRQINVSKQGWEDLSFIWSESFSSILMPLFLNSFFHFPSSFVSLSQTSKLIQSWCLPVQSQTSTEPPTISKLPNLSTSSSMRLKVFVELDVKDGIVVGSWANTNVPNQSWVISKEKSQGDSISLRSSLISSSIFSFSLSPQIEMYSTKSGIKLSVTSDQPAIQAYTCDGISSAKGNLPRKRAHGGDGTLNKFYDNHSCVVLEMEGYIDGINHPEWNQDQIYDPSRPYVWESEYKFSTVDENGKAIQQGTEPTTSSSISATATATSVASSSTAVVTSSAWTSWTCRHCDFDALSFYSSVFVFLRTLPTVAEHSCFFSILNLNHPSSAPFVRRWYQRAAVILTLLSLHALFHFCCTFFYSSKISVSSEVRVER